MASSLIQKMYEEFKARGEYSIPRDLQPPEQGYCLTAWVRELFIHYQAEGIVARALDDLPAIQLSREPGLALALQDVHKFIISDLNLIPLEGKKKIIEQAAGHESSAAAWGSIIPLLLEQLRGMNREAVQEEVTWKFSPVGEVLWVLTWFFMEREKVVPPRATRLQCSRFPYYTWVLEKQGEPPVIQSLWAPDNPLCRWEWLAADLFYQWLQSGEEY
jgi:hypothetical protein